VLSKTYFRGDSINKGNFVALRVLDNLKSFNLRRKWNPTAKNEDIITTAEFLRGKLPDHTAQVSKLWNYLNTKTKNTNYVEQHENKVGDIWNLGKHQ
jgi:hypothetical protein